MEYGVRFVFVFQGVRELGSDQTRILNCSIGNRIGIGDMVMYSADIC